MTGKLRCFVAMAFGHEDTDSIYEQSIKPAIIEAGLTPIRIDKLVHNDRIDARIRSEIEKADILIADLTYARPSVYWEAGFAERVIPVIYTCRADHFLVSPDDKFGNQKVHFDLANANIMQWVEKDHKKFNKELLKRINFVAEGKREQKQNELLKKEDRILFSKESQQGKILLVSFSIIAALQKLKYKQVVINDTQDPMFNFPQKGADFKNRIFWKVIENTGVMISAFNCHSTMMNSDLRGAGYSGIFQQFISLDNQIYYDELPPNLRKIAKSKIKEIRFIKIIPVLNKLSNERVQRYLPYWKYTGFDEWYYYPHNQKIGIKFSKEIVLISNIKSLYEFNEVTQKILLKIEDNSFPIK